LEGSLVAIEVKTGNVLALVGGRDFHSSRYDRVTQARRPPGSAFKPIVFAAALERGYAPGNVLDALDAPISTASGDWLPEGEHEASQYTLRSALKVSSNRAAAQLMQRVGISSAIDISRRLGITSPLPVVPSLALGTGEVTLLELTAAYAAFANRGLVASPRFISRVEDRYGQVLWEESALTRRALSESTAFLMSTMLADVINGGTAAAARRAGFRLPAAGKTGTSENYADAWFVGYTPKIVAGVWFGYDRPSTIQRRGFAGVVAVPAWADFMKRATASDKAEWLAMPAGVERVEVCRLSGQRAVEGCRLAATVEQVVWEASDTGVPYPRVIPAGGVFEEYFAVGTAPWDTCAIHSAYAAFDSRDGLQP
jgi:penicillin-binding protein 1A